MTIIKIYPEVSGAHIIESQSHRTENWMGAEWITVPPCLETEVMTTGGYCELDIRDGVLVGITATDKPDPEPEPEPEPTQLDRVEAQVTYTAMMTDTLLEV